MALLYYFNMDVFFILELPLSSSLYLSYTALWCSPLIHPVWKKLISFPLFNPQATKHLNVNLYEHIYI